MRLHAEAAADVARDDADAALRHLEHRVGEAGAHAVDVLGRAVERKALGAGIVLADAAAHLHRRRRQPVVVERQLRNVRRLVEGRTDGVLVAHLQREADVVLRFRVDLRRAVLHGVCRACDRRQLGIVDLDQGGRVARLRLGLGDHHGDALADEAHPVGHQRPARRAVALRPAHVLRHHAGHQRAHAVVDIILAGQHGDDARRRRGLAGVDRPDVAMRDRREHEHGMGHARQHDVVDILAAAGEKLRIFLAVDRLADAETHVFLPNPYGWAGAGLERRAARRLLPSSVPGLAGRSKG